MAFSGNITLAKKIASGGGDKPTPVNFADITGDLKSNQSAHATLQRMLNTQETFRPSDQLFRFITNVAPINDTQKVLELCYLHQSNVGVSVDINKSYSNNYKQFTGDYFLGKKIYCTIGHEKTNKSFFIAKNVDQVIEYTGCYLQFGIWLPAPLTIADANGNASISTPQGIIPEAFKYTIKFTEK